MKVPFMDFTRIHKPLKKDFQNAFNVTTDKGDFILGSPVAEFENHFASFCGCRYAIGVGSGTDALYLSLLALGVGPGDEVITAANTFIATVLAISYTGARPVLVDVNPKTYNIDIAGMEKAITNKTKVLLPVHLYGSIADMDEIKNIADVRGLKIIEDACQAHGALYKGKRAGAMGDAGCFSFYPAKNLGAFGDGGMIVTDNSAIVEKARLLRNYGSVKKYYHDIKGFNSRLDTLQARLLDIKLPSLAGWNESRRRAADVYVKELASAGCVVPEVSDDRQDVYHLFIIRTAKRDQLQAFLKERGVDTGIHYPIPIHKTEAFKELGGRGAFSITEKYAAEILSLPMFPGITDEEILYVCNIIKEFFKK
ncbi:DegT/DnrJ/EryC1/StrS family aminotransferase [bacterium]|nr:DegT/DnrJ/EryC1/StrS family aminotransferase [bacterium]